MTDILLTWYAWVAGVIDDHTPHGTQNASTHSPRKDEWWFYERALHLELTLTDYGTTLTAKVRGRLMLKTELHAVAPVDVSPPPNEEFLEPTLKGILEGVKALWRQFHP